MCVFVIHLLKAYTSAELFPMRFSPQFELRKSGRIRCIETSNAHRWRAGRHCFDIARLDLGLFLIYRKTVLFC